MSRSDVHPIHRFQPWQVWPGSYDNPPADGSYPHPDTGGVVIDKSTPISSMGSCFAREIKTVLVREGFSYIVTEEGHPATKHASAAWERTYNTFSMRQIFQYTFEDWQPDLRWWISPESGKVQDPYRRIILYDSIEQAEADFARHRDCSRRALEQARCLILTLGLTELWEDKTDGSVICLPSGPYVNEGGSMDRYRFKVSRYSENLDNMEQIHRLMSAHNPECQLLITVSPVHLWATFREDLDVISASCNSKATLRAVADEFVSRHENVFYFPAFEMASIYRPIMGQSIFTEGREPFHVNQDTVEFIMGQFFDFYVSRDRNDDIFG
ncbi:GSCFA domain-containing protein [Thermodesulfobacteriota bacterium]